MFKEQRDVCLDLKQVLNDVELRSIFIAALNVEVFSMYKEEYYRDPGLYPEALNALFSHANAYFIRKCAAFPAMAKVLTDTSGFAVYAIHR